MSKELEVIARIAKEPKTLEEIGRNLITAAAKAVLEEKMGIKPSNPDSVRIIQKGEVVPADLINRPNLKIGPGGVADTSWTDSWLNFGLWDRSWSESAGQMYPIRSKHSIFRNVRAELVLTPTEIKIAKDLKIDL